MHACFGGSNCWHQLHPTNLKMTPECSFWRFTSWEWKKHISILCTLQENSEHIITLIPYLFKSSCLEHSIFQFHWNINSCDCRQILRFSPVINNCFHLEMMQFEESTYVTATIDGIGVSKYFTLLYLHTRCLLSFKNETPSNNLNVQPCYVALSAT